MKHIISLCLLLIAGFCAFAQQAAQIVAPNGLENVEGNSSAMEPFNSSSFRFQQVFDASQFAIPLGASARIDRISFRIDGASSGRVLYAFDGGTVQLSTTMRAPDTLSPVFSENIGGDVRTIYDGGLAINGAFQSGAITQPFTGNVLAGAAYFYIPSQGNLLLDITAGGGRTFLPGAFDAQLTIGDSVSRVFATSETAISGMADSFGLVTRFDITIVPEPSRAVLTIIGSLLGLAILRVRRNRSRR